MIAWVDSALTRWGSWASRNTGYPSVSPMFRDMPSSKVFGASYEAGYTPTDMLVLDECVNRLTAHYRAVLVAYYQYGKGWSQAARRTGMDRNKVKRMVLEAQEIIAKSWPLDT